MTGFEFSVRGSLRRAWDLFTKHTVYFLGLALVMALFSFVSKRYDDALPSILITLVSVLWSYVTISSVLAAIDGKEERLNLKAFSSHLPSVKQFFFMIGLMIALLLFIGAGFILLIIPGIYFAVRLTFSNLAFVDQKEGIVASMKYSWRLVKGDIFWTVLLGLLVAGVMVFLGMLLFGIGLLVAYPVSMLFLGILYRALVQHHTHESAVVEQPQEITPPPTVSTEQPQNEMAQ
jgi:uncharacterized membrane protein